MTGQGPAATRPVPPADAALFEEHRPALLALAYRMLGEIARAEDMVQEAWVRWQGRQVEVDAPKAFLLTTVTRLCLDELGSARARHEETRGERLPEPIDLAEGTLGRVELIDRISMAFLVLLQRLTPAERAVLLLHDVFEMNHGEIAALLHKNDVACRQLLGRARAAVATEKRALTATREEHQRLLGAFVRAVVGGEPAALIDLLAEDAVLRVDAGKGGARFGQIRNVTRPVVGRARVVALLGAFARQGTSGLVVRERLLNGEPAAIAYHDGQVLSAIVVSVEAGRIREIFVQLDRERLGHVGPGTNGDGSPSA